MSLFKKVIIPQRWMTRKCNKFHPVSENNKLYHHHPFVGLVAFICLEVGYFLIEEKA